jgi:hypothetical protein
MADNKAGASGDAKNATAKTEPNSPDRPASIPDSYVWDEKLGPVDESTGEPTGAWREPDEKTGK